MDSRPLLRNAKKIQVYIDSKTFDELLTSQDRLATAILRHCDSECLVFVRSPLETKHKELKQIAEYRLSIKESEIKSIEFEQADFSKRSLFHYRMQDIRKIAEKIYGRDRITQTELDMILSVFIQAVFNRFEKSNIYVTNDKILLKNRLWFESHSPGGPLNIMSVEEAAIFLDLFFKKNGNYFASSRYHLNKGFWYWLSMRLKLPHFNVGDPMMDALAFRFYYALMALDEIGIQFYLGTDNDTMDNTLYHFNYLISLITGIFDNLALKTNTHLGIDFSDLRKVSLSNKSGKEFLREVRKKNKAIRDHISSYMNFIQLIYTFRETVVHREGLAKVRFEYVGKNIRWRANFTQLSEEQKDYIRLCGDIKSEFDPFTQWGVYVATNVFLEPYHFSLKTIAMLMKFVDEYLQLLGYSSFIETQKQKDEDFTHTLNLFERCHLGF